MATMKKFAIVPRCSESELESKVNDGWQIQFMEFSADGTTLRAVFVRELAANEPAPETVVVEPVAVTEPRTIPNKPLPAGSVIVMEPPRSVPLTHNRAEKGSTRPVTVPTGDPVVADAMRRSRETFDRVVAEGNAAIHQASQSFYKYKQ